jgi:hypothetical protein
VACQPLLAPAYLNFVTDIVAVSHKSHPSEPRPYLVNVRYRHLLKAQGLVTHVSDTVGYTVTLSHDGPLAQFDATFHLKSDHVMLTCRYRAKSALMTWLVGKVLARALDQVAAAMDRYAAALPVLPT